jgi:hypothetical protein
VEFLTVNLKIFPGVSHCSDIAVRQCARRPQNAVFLHGWAEEVNKNAFCGCSRYKKIILAAVDSTEYYHDMKIDATFFTNTGVTG